MGEARSWPALIVRSRGAEAPRYTSEADLLSALIDDFSPAAIEDLNELPLPPGGLWDPTFPPVPEPPPAPLAWRVFFNSHEQRDRAGIAIRAAWPQFQVAAEDIPDENWAARSQQSLHAVTAGKFIVAPPWDQPPSPGTHIVIVIEPSRGFGTGHHASTRLCLRALTDLDVRHLRVLDLGTGSGVLALAAAYSGAREVTAVDIDDDAIAAARESAALNATPIGIDFRASDFRSDKWIDQRGPFDLILANLTGGMLISSAARIRQLMSPRGQLVLSGFDEGELPAVQAALLPLVPVTTLRDEGWIGLVTARSDRA